MAIVFSAYIGGLMPGLISAALAWSYIASFLSLFPAKLWPIAMWTFTALSWGITMPATAILVDRLKRHADDEALTLRALKQNNIVNEVTIAHYGVEALDFLFRWGVHADRDINEQPAVILLDLKLPKIDGLEVLKLMRADEHLKLLPVVILTSSKEEQDMLSSYSLGANSCIRKPVDFTKFVDAVRQLGVYWLVLNEPPPNGTNIR